MNFFTHQDKARSTTRKLVLLFICAIAVLIGATSLLVVTLLTFTEDKTGIDVVGSETFLYVSVGVIVVVGLGALFRMMQLRGGGRAVAEAMGGRLVNVSSHDAHERKILNVVEEMAIAAGLSVPPVYLIEDEAINAFAAGYHQVDAVIGVTRGCIVQLSREELQGVIAHEFSHIFNGDMRLNIRLMGLLYGIMVLGIIGYVIIRGTRFSSSRNKKGGGLVLVGFGLVVIGYGGTFFGNMIKAAVSRQREFLADASAVQFTRNPGGIGGALKKIGGYGPGSRIKSADVSEISHMLFGEGLSAGFTGLFATHPPLAERIRKIDPSWNGVLTKSSSPGGSTESSLSGNEQVAGFSGDNVSSAAAGTSRPAVQSAIESIGDPSTEHINLAVSQLQRIPSAIKDDAHNTFGACALIHALLLASSKPEDMARQLAVLENNLPPEQFRELVLVQERVKGLDRDLYLTVIDIALPSLKQLSPSQCSAFVDHLTQLIMIDKHISLFEWSLYQILLSNLEQRIHRKGRALELESIAHECEVLLSILADVGHDDEEQTLVGFAQAKDMLKLQKVITFNKNHLNNIKVLEKSVLKVARLKPLQKPLLLKAMVKCIDADGQVTVEEAELLRAIASLIDCPIPPLLSDQKFM